MERATVEAITEKLREISGRLNEIAQLVETIEDLAERRRFRRHWATVTSHFITEPERSVCAEYPDLRPD